MPDFRFPNDQQRLVIFGATGSGKTNAAMWQLSERNFHVKPWIIYNFKNDELIDGIEGTQPLELGAPLPQRPGIFVVHPYPGQEQEVDDQLTEIWHQENIGVYVDEGFMIPRNSQGFRRLLTQGRSKHIPMITNTQRPVWMDRFVISEAEFYQVFRLQHRKDLQAVQEFVPNPDPDKDHPLDERLPEYWSFYYDVGRNQLMKIRPVPDPDAIADTFDMRLRQIRKVT